MSVQCGLPGGYFYFPLSILNNSSSSASETKTDSTNNTFISNNGGITIIGDHQTTVATSSFENNFAARGAALLAIKTFSVLIEQSTFEENAGDLSGAVDVTAYTIDIDSNTFVENKAESKCENVEGGAVRIEVSGQPK